MGTSTTTAAVVVCAHASKRLALTVACVESVLAGRRPPDELYLVVDNNPGLESDLRQALDGRPVEILPNDGVGASDARTTAISRSTCDVIAFIDDDARAESDWLVELAEVFDDPAVVGAGGRILPDWEPGARILPAELWWVVGSTYRGHPEGKVPISRPVGASMAARRRGLAAVGGFPTEFGPRGGKKSSSNEELALYSRLRQRFGADCVLYVPSAVVHHFAPAARTTWGYLVSRSWAEGTSKADARRVFGRQVMGHDSGYVREILLPAIVVGFGRGVRRGDRRALADASACLLVLVVTAAGYVWRLGSPRRRWSRRGGGGAGDDVSTPLPQGGPGSRAPAV